MTCPHNFIYSDTVFPFNGVVPVRVYRCSLCTEESLRPPEPSDFEEMERRDDMEREREKAKERERLEQKDWNENLILPESAVNDEDLIRYKKFGASYG